MKKNNIISLFFLSISVLTASGITTPLKAASIYREELNMLLKEIIRHNIILSEENVGLYLQYFNRFIQAGKTQMAIDLFVYLFEGTGYQEEASAILSRYFSYRIFVDKSTKIRTVKQAIRKAQQENALNDLLDLQENQNYRSYHRSIKLAISQIIKHLDYKQDGQAQANQEHQVSPPARVVQQDELNQEQLHELIKADYLSALQRNDLETIIMILQDHASVMENTNDVISATQNNQEKVLRFLIEIAQKDANQKDEEGNTALHHACIKGYTNIVNFLVTEAHANLQARNAKNQSALQGAREHNHNDIIKLLEEKLIANLPENVECPVCLVENQEIEPENRVISPCCHNFICRDCIKLQPACVMCRA